MSIDPVNHQTLADQLPSLITPKTIAQPGKKPIIHETVLIRPNIRQEKAFSFDEMTLRTSVLYNPHIVE